MKTKPEISDLDLYINSIVEKLRVKYSYADKTPLNSSVRFCYRYSEPFPFPLRGFKIIEEVIELTYTELTESMNKKEYPNQIKKIL